MAGRRAVPRRAVRRPRFGGAAAAGRSRGGNPVAPASGRKYLENPLPPSVASPRGYAMRSTSLWSPGACLACTAGAPGQSPDARGSLPPDVRTAAPRDGTQPATALPPRPEWCALADAGGQRIPVPELAARRVTDGDA